MRHIATITWLTFHEAWRRRMVLFAIGLGVLFLGIYGLGLWLINDSLPPRLRTSERQIGFSMLMLAGLYVTHFLTIMLAIFASADSVAGEISTHTIQTLVTKPIRRWHIVIGKWLGYAAMICLYISLIAGGVVLLVRLISGYQPPNIVSGLSLLLLEALVLLALSLLGGTRFSTLTNGVLLFMLYGLSFIGSWVEQIGALLESRAAVNIGIITSLVLPVEALWRRASYLMQPPLLRAVPTPFNSSSPPSNAMVIFAVIYMLVALLLAVWSFNRRDL
jgi:Cu-processing system permease protein